MRDIEIIMLHITYTGINLIPVNESVYKHCLTLSFIDIYNKIILGSFELSSVATPWLVVGRMPPIGV